MMKSIISKTTVIFISMVFFVSAVACPDCIDQQLFDYDYPFKPFLIEFSSSVLEKIQDNDILFVGEGHVASVFLREIRKGSKSKNKIG